MKWIGPIVMAILAIAFLTPACMAQSSQTVDIIGYVYNGALPVDGARVQVYTWDGQHMGTSPMKTTTSGQIGGVHGGFEFKNVPYDPSKTFNWVIQAENNGAQAHALVYVVPPQTASQTPKVDPIILDLNMWDWKTDLVGMVQSGNLAQDAMPIVGANVSIYAYKNGTLGTTPVAAATTGNDGTFEIENVLDYGQYQAVAITKDNHISKANFTSYQQQTRINLVMTDIILATATPSPSGKPTSGGGGFFGLPGFEAVLALAALSGAAFYLKKR